MGWSVCMSVGVRVKGVLCIVGHILDDNATIRAIFKSRFLNMNRAVHIQPDLE